MGATIVHDAASEGFISHLLVFPLSILSPLSSIRWALHLLRSIKASPLFAASVASAQIMMDQQGLQVA